MNSIICTLYIYLWCMCIHIYTQRVRSRTADSNFLTLRVTTI